MFSVLGNAVCQSSLEVCPNKFIGVKLGRISRKVKGMNSRVFFKESVDKLCPVKRASVPEENDGAFEVPAKMPEELSDLSSPDVPVDIEARVESKPLSFWGDRDGGDGRYLCPSACDNENRGSSFDRPGSLDVGNKREPALIQEGQAGSKQSGLFLYAAKRDVSSNGSILRVFPWLFWSAPDNSSPKRSSDSKGCRYNNAPESVFGSPARCASKSKDRLDNRLPEDLSPKRVPSPSSDSVTKDKAAPYSESILVPRDLFSGRSGANAPRSLKKRRVLGPPTDKSGPVSTSGRPNAAAFRVFWVCHGVS